MRDIKRTALLCALLLLLCGCAAADDDDIATYVQPDGVQICALEDIGYFTAPDGLQSMYSLMKSDNAAASTYVFIMPNGRVLLSLACTEVAASGTAQSLLDSWDAIASGLSALNANTDTSVANVRLDKKYGFDTLHINTGITMDGTPPLMVFADGVAFYRGNELMELWTVYPGDAGYTEDPNAEDELLKDLQTVVELSDSFDFGAGPAVDEAAMADSVPYEDPNGRFSLRIPKNTIAITPDTDADTLARERTRYAEASKGGDLVFDEWMTEVTENDATLLLMHDYGLACHIFCQEGEQYRGLSAKDYLRLSGALAQSLTERFGFCEVMSDNTTEVISGLEHARLTLWLRDLETNIVLNLFAATDGEGRLREVDLHTMVDSTADFDTRERITQLILQTLQYQ